MDIWYYLMIPFTGLLKFFYGFFNNYGLALILFTLVVKVILFPFALKGKKSMIKMNMLNGKLQKLQKMYGNNREKYNLEVQKLYEKENVSPTGGCLWSFLPLLILFPLYAIIRRPLKYWLGLTDAVIANVTAAVAGAGVVLNPAYPEISSVAAFFTNPGALSAGQAAAEGATLYGINFSFLGIDLAAKPVLKFWENGLSWGSIGLFLVPILTAGTAFLSSQIMMKTNQINQGDNAAANNGSNKMMMILSPLMMLYFSFIMPAGMGLYMIASSLFSMAQEVICGKMLAKDYAKAAEEMKQRAIEEKEEEKRLRREKAEQKAREAEEARKNKGKKKAKADTEDDGRTTAEQKEASRVGIRQYARGRAYDPDRYGGVTPYHEDAEAAERFKEKVAAGEIVPKEEPKAPESAPAVEEKAPEAELPAVEAAPAEEAAPMEEAAPVEEAAPAEAVQEDIVEQLQAEIDEAVNDEEPKND